MSDGVDGDGVKSDGVSSDARDRGGRSSRARTVTDRGVPIAGAFWFLATHAARNRVRQQLQRVRSPRYVIAMALGALYFWSVFFRRGASTNEVAWGSFLLSDTAQLVASALLFVTVVRWWLFGGDRSALAFTPAEVHFLFPAPVTRRGLVHFKLLRAQMLVALNIVLWIAITRRGAPEVPLVLRAVGFWTMFSTLHLHRLGAALVHASASDAGRRGLWRHRIAIGLVTIAIVALGASALGAMADFRNAYATSELLIALRAWIQSPVPAAVLWPARTAIALAYASTTAEWLRALLPAGALLALHYIWVLRADDAFEEAAAEASADRAARIAAARGGGGVLGASMAGDARRDARTSDDPAGVRTAATAGSLWHRVRRGMREPERVRRPWFPLATTGRPAVAILWKNIVLVTRPLRWATLLLVLGLVAAVVVVAQQSGNRALAGNAVAMVAAVMAVFLTAFGPLWTRNDLRQDLKMLDLLRTFPLRGSAVVGAEIASSALTITALQWLLAFSAYAAAALGGRMPVDLAARTAILAAALVGLPVLSVLGVTVQNAGALLFPEWVRLGARGGGGVEAMGQNILTTAFTTLCTALALVVPLLAATVTAVVILLWAGVTPSVDALTSVRTILTVTSALVGAAIVLLAVVAVEVWLAVRWLGGVFERTDRVHA